MNKIVFETEKNETEQLRYHPYLPFSCMLKAIEMEKKLN
jgi:hypothetical protein